MLQRCNMLMEVFQTTGRTEQQSTQHVLRVGHQAPLGYSMRARLPGEEPKEKKTS